MYVVDKIVPIYGENVKKNYEANDENVGDIFVNLGSHKAEYFCDTTVKQTINGFNYKKNKYFCPTGTPTINHHIKWKTKYICNQLYLVPGTRYLQYNFNMKLISLPWLVWPSVLSASLQTER